MGGDERFGGKHFGGGGLETSTITETFSSARLSILNSESGDQTAKGGVKTEIQLLIRW